MRYVLVFWLLLGMLPRAGAAQGFTAPGDMTPPVMHAYLARSITMAGLAELKLQTLQNPSPAATALYQRQITMLATLNARYIGRAAGMWTGEDRLPALKNALALLLADLHAAYRAKGITEMPIVEGAVFEIATATVGGIRIPEDVWQKFSSAPYTGQHFDINEIGYSVPVSAGSLPTEILPDMHREQTQMWFYYVATQYLEAGCEAIHFGQVEIMSKADADHAGWWKMLSAVRAYAATRNRGLVLCSAHSSFDMYYDPDPSQPEATHQRQLLFDLKAAPIWMQEDVSKPWLHYAGGGGAYLDDKGAGCTTSIFHNTNGGRSYLWGPVASLPVLVDIDNGGRSASPGRAGSQCWVWGWDEITWFGEQLPGYRNQWLKYAYYQVRCLDPDGHLEMPGLREMTEGPPAARRQYRANNGPVSQDSFNQETMIGDLWNGVYDPDWSYTDVTDASLTTAPDKMPVDGYPVYVGQDIYYIGADGHLHGYLKTSTGWVAVSPSYVAAAHDNQPLGSQQPAAGGLVASPDGTFLCYRGTDGELYKHDIVEAGNHYPYSRLAPASAPLPGAERVQSDLVCASPSLIYYRSASKELYGYLKQGPAWYPISPACSAGPAPTRPVPLAGGLVVGAAGILYYPGSDGQLHGFAPLDAQGWGYAYFDLPVLSSAGVSGQLVAAAGDRLFYVSQPDGRVYGLQRTTDRGAETAPAGHGRWVSSEGSWAAQLAPDGLLDQVPAAGELAASPDGRLLAYVGRDGALHGLRLTDATTTEYLDFTPPATKALWPTKGLRLRSATEFCYVAATPYQTYLKADQPGAASQADTSTPPASIAYPAAHKLVVGELTGQPAVCANPAIAYMQKPYDRARVATRPAPPPALAPAPAASLSYHLSPATADLQVELASKAPQPATQAALQDVLGRRLQTVPLAASRPGVLAASLPVQRLVPGVYLLVVTTGAGQRYTSRVAVPAADQ